MSTLCEINAHRVLESQDLLPPEASTAGLHLGPSDPTISSGVLFKLNTIGPTKFTTLGFYFCFYEPFVL